MKFAMFMLGEYLGLMLISCMITTLFFGGWLGPWLPPVVWFTLKVFALICFFILLRAAIPRAIMVQPASSSRIPTSRNTGSWLLRFPVRAAPPCLCPELIRP